LILFCIPYAGGGAEAFDGWQQALSPGVEVRVADLPGRGMRFGEPLIDHMPTLVALLARQCWAPAGVPVAVLGYSFGAIAAYALTLHLQQLGRTPQRLLVGGAPAPFLPRRTAPRHTMSDEALIAELAALDGTPSDVLRNREVMAVYLPILRADFRTIETYDPVAGDPAGGRVHCPLSVFGGDQDPVAKVAELAAWQQLTDLESDLHLYHGGHFILQSQRDKLCRTVRALLALDEQAAPPPASRTARVAGG
jgi:surfactin synthase thioesterase subunit